MCNGTAASLRRGTALAIADDTTRVAGPGQYELKSTLQGDGGGGNPRLRMPGVKNRLGSKRWVSQK